MKKLFAKTVFTFFMSSSAPLWAASTPTETAKAYFGALRQGNFDLLKTTMRTLDPGQEAHWRALMGSMKKQYKDYELVDVLVSSTSKDQASATFKLRKKDQKKILQEGPIHLFKDNSGNWKVGDLHEH
jgi:hypothetical protein